MNTLSSERPPDPTELSDIQIAMIAHEANRLYCESLSDGFPTPWADTPRIIQDSIIHGVCKLRSRMTEDEEYLPDPVEQHNEWMEYKLREGWTYGPIKDALKKTHPNLLPFSSLPLSEQKKDFLFTAIVQALH